MACEDESVEYLDEYRRHQNIKTLLTSLEQFSQNMGLGYRDQPDPERWPLTTYVVCYMLLRRLDTRDLTIGVKGENSVFISCSTKRTILKVHSVFEKVCVIKTINRSWR